MEREKYLLDVNIVRSTQIHSVGGKKAKISVLTLMVNIVTT